MQQLKSVSNGTITKRWPLGMGLLMALLFAGWFAIGNAIAESPKPGGVLKFGTESDFAGFEVLESTSRLAINGAIAANTIMEPLFRRGGDGALIPVLASTIRQSNDGKAWTIELRKQVRFHDGSPFNADAVVHHWKRMLDPQNKFRARAAMGPILDVTKSDEHTVKFILKHAWLPFEKVIGSTRGLINLIPSTRSVEAKTQNRAPVGTGPFRFKSWESGSAFTVVRNPNYRRKDHPYFDEIIFFPMPDAQTRFASLKSDQLDMIWSDQGNIINKAGKDTSLTVYAGEDNGAEIFVLNTAKPPFDDVSVRRALAHAHHQERHVKMVYEESIPMVHTPFGDQCRCDEDGYRAYDPQEARRLLAKYGQPVEIELLHSNSKRGRDIGEISQRLFKDVGIATKPVGLDFGPVIKKVISGQYQISTWRISSRPDQGPALFLMFHSKSRANFSHYQNPEMDRLLLAQRMETDPVKREEILCRIARLINEDAPILYRGGMRSHIITRNAVKGISNLTDGIVRLEEVWFSR